MVWALDPAPPWPPRAASPEPLPLASVLQPALVLALAQEQPALPERRKLFRFAPRRQDERRRRAGKRRQWLRRSNRIRRRGPRFGFPCRRARQEFERCARRAGCRSRRG